MAISGNELRDKFRFQEFRKRLGNFIGRSARRELIRDQLEETDGSLREVIRNVRELESDNDLARYAKDSARRLSQELTEQMLLVDEPSAGVLEYLSEELRTEFPWVKALVLLGSATHGGTAVRRMLDNPGHMDLDWGVIVDSNSSFIDTHALTIRGGQIIKRLVESKDDLVDQFPSNYHGCPAVNPENHSVNDYSDLSFDILEKLDWGYFGIKGILLFFQPTFPEEVGEANRQVILSYLSELSIKNRSKYDRIVRDLLTYWFDIHTLKPKHFAKVETDNMAIKIESKELSTKATELMRKTFVDLIQSTDMKAGK